MSNLITDWRLAVMAQLETELQDGSFTVVGGELDGARRDKLACVFAPSLQTDSSNVTFARPVLIVRAWIPDPKTPKRTVPPDPAPVEQLMVDLATCLEPIQALPDVGMFGLYFFVTQIQPDYKDFGVQAILQGWAGNPATLPAPP